MPDDDKDQEEQSDQRKDHRYTEGTLDSDVDSSRRKPLPIHPPDDKRPSESGEDKPT